MAAAEGLKGEFHLSGELLGAVCERKVGAEIERTDRVEMEKFFWSETTYRRAYGLTVTAVESGDMQRTRCRGRYRRPLNKLSLIHI